MCMGKCIHFIMIGHIFNENDSKKTVPQCHFSDSNIKGTG